MWEDGYSTIVKCKCGTLAAGQVGDIGLYDGIGIDLRREDGSMQQCLTIETTPEGILHVLVWKDGNNGDPTVIEIDPHGNGENVF